MKIEHYEAYKNSGIEWLNEVPEHWEIKRVKDIVKKIGNGVTPRGGSEVYSDLGITFLRSQNIYNDGLRIDNVSFISEEIHEGMKGSQLKMGDILINITGASIGRTCLFSLESGSANINQHIAFLRTKFWINEIHISLFLKSHFIKNYIEIEQNGASKEAFNLSQIANIPIVLPSQLEQKAIAHYLDTKTAQIDRKIDLLTQKATQYGNLKQSLINKTVTRGLDKSVPMKDSAIEWIGEVPEHWEEKRIKDLSSLQSGINITSEQIEEIGQYPVYGGNGLRGYFSKYTNEGNYILIGRQGALCGNINYASGKFWATEHAVVVYLKRSVDVKWYGAMLKMMNLNQYSLSAAQPGLAVDRIKRLLLFVPPLSEQKAIADYLDTKTDQIDQIIQTINTQIKKLKELRKTLINDVVTGKIRVIEDDPSSRVA